MLTLFKPTRTALGLAALSLSLFSVNASASTFQYEVIASAISGDVAGFDLFFTTSRAADELGAKVTSASGLFDGKQIAGLYKGAINADLGTGVDVADNIFVTDNAFTFAGIAIDVDGENSARLFNFFGGQLFTYNTNGEQSGSAWIGDNFKIIDHGNIDNPSAVPEPETYAMLLAGLGLVGFSVRRRS